MSTIQKSYCANIIIASKSDIISLTKERISRFYKKFRNVDLTKNQINDIYDKITRKTNIVKDIQKMSLKRIVVKELVNRGKGNSLDDLAETVKEYLYEITKMMVEGFLLTNKVIFFNF